MNTTIPEEMRTDLKHYGNGSIALKSNGYRTQGASVSPSHAKALDGIFNLAPHLLSGTRVMKGLDEDNNDSGEVVNIQA